MKIINIAPCQVSITAKNGDMLFVSCGSNIAHYKKKHQQHTINDRFYKHNSITMKHVARFMNTDMKTVHQEVKEGYTIVSPENEFNKTIAKFIKF